MKYLPLLIAKRYANWYLVLTALDLTGAVLYKELNRIRGIHMWTNRWMPAAWDPQQNRWPNILTRSVFKGKEKQQVHQSVTRCFHLGNHEPEEGGGAVLNQIIYWDSNLKQSLNGAYYHKGSLSADAFGSAFESNSREEWRLVRCIKPPSASVSPRNGGSRLGSIPHLETRADPDGSRRKGARRRLCRSTGGREVGRNDTSSGASAGDNHHGGQSSGRWNQKHPPAERELMLSKY